MPPYRLGWNQLLIAAGAAEYEPQARTFRRVDSLAAADGGSALASVRGLGRGRPARPLGLFVAADGRSAPASVCGHSRRRTVRHWLRSGNERAELFEIPRHRGPRIFIGFV